MAIICGFALHTFPDGVESIGIDEFAVRKGHVCKTIVVDLKTGRILYVGDGKSEESLSKLSKFKQFGKTFNHIVRIGSFERVH